MVLALHRGGYETRQAGSGEEALSLLKRQSVDAVVLDVAMPGLSGIDVVKALRADPETATLPILIITGSGDHETVLQALEAGADDFVSKPVRLDELVARIRAHLRTGEAWSSQVEAELRGRADLVGVLGGLSLSADSDDAAAALVAELGRSAGCEFVGVLQMAEHGHLTVLATYDEQGGVQRGGTISTDREKYFLSRVRDGPWVEIVGSRMRDESATAFWAPNVELAAGAPIFAGTRVVGILVTGQSRVDPVSSPARQSRLLAAVIDYANILSVAAGPSIAAHRRLTETRARLERVIATRAFYAVFQPIVDLAGRSVTGYEALTRFTDGTPPDIRFAEAAEYGLGVELEAVAIDTALQAASLLPISAPISLNASPALVMDHDRIAASLALAKEPIVLELTEHARIEDYEGLRSALASYGSGVRLAIDDAGAGYASLRHILELRPAFVKLDLSIVRGIESDQVRQALVSGLVYFAGKTGSAMIAEGVETEAEAGILNDLGIEFGQGFLFGRPEPVVSGMADEHRG